MINHGENNGRKPMKIRFIQLFSVLATTLLLLALGGLSHQAIAEVNMYFVHNDHLGTPIAVTDQGQSVVWEAEKEPFGNTTTSGGLQVRSRFPGQIFDEETGLHYNYFRDYDPSLGRYIQSDPIGLLGGLNTYAYVHNSPTRHTDPYGLFVPLVIPGICAAGGCEALAVAASVAYCALNPACSQAVENIIVDPDKPIPPQLPGYVDPFKITTTTESCPTGGEPPNDPREQCFNGVTLKYAACLQSASNPLLCQIKRAIGLLACAASSAHGGG